MGTGWLLMAEKPPTIIQINDECLDLIEAIADDLRKAFPDQAHKICLSGALEIVVKIFSRNLPYFLEQDDPDAKNTLN